MSSSIREIVENQTLLSITPEASVHQASVLMATHRIGALPVLRGTELIGIVTERDLVSRVLAPRLDPERTPVTQVMTEKPITIGSDQAPCDALDLMNAHGFRHLLVVEGEQLIGVLSMRDIPVRFMFLREKWLEMSQGRR
jgi:CBS domain-containing protein